jgi:hypothetical protein
VRPLTFTIAGAAALLSLASCTPWRTSYLQSGLGRLTKDSVSVRLGPPSAERPLSNGGTVWRYVYTRSAVVGSSGNGYGSLVGTSRCDEYLVVFDASAVLRSFTRQKC